jgi:hypothetical protein
MIRKAIKGVMTPTSAGQYIIVDSIISGSVDIMLVDIGSKSRVYVIDRFGDKAFIQNKSVKYVCDTKEEAVSIRDLYRKCVADTIAYANSCIALRDMALEKLAENKG